MTEFRSVAVVGTGAIGSAVARRLLTGGHDVVVWNRTPARTAGLVESGAVPARTVTEAVATTELVLLTVTDQEAARQCLDQLDGGLAGRTVVTMCTGTPEEARRSSAEVARLGGHYLDAGIQAGPDAIGTEAATILYSGDRTAYERHSETLRLLAHPGSSGPRPTRQPSGTLRVSPRWSGETTTGRLPPGAGPSIRVRRIRDSNS
ncbi:NAD(P)-binding domain-containing protein [Micromonospora sp. NPDC126480]|uniref:NAD(P)-dependent oxidoreductase n=1 Tax=Micromonospora sp. NPDC126480 TaxID=3155312 RepID=UPI00331B6631